MNQFKNAEYLSFNEARDFVRKLKLKSRNEWRNYYDKNKLNIPKNPNCVYKEWINWGDWLGTFNMVNQKITYLSFDLARNFVRNLNLKNGKEWNKYCKSGNKPENIPNCPENVYKNKGWINWGDWLGTFYINNRNRTYLSFEDARKFVRSLNLKSAKEWRDYWTENNPTDIPKNANLIYKDNWISFGDWLGTTIKFKKGDFLSFEDARNFSRSLNLKTVEEWVKYTKSKDIPYNIPVGPASAYKNEWLSWSDWLGTKNGFNGYLSFEEAREFVRKLNLKSEKEWNDYCKSGNKPNNISSSPRSTYKKEWINISDWLGTGFYGFLPFEEARDFVRKLNLKNELEWKNYYKSKDKPNNIPATPNNVYKENWLSLADWLGTKIGFDGFLPFEEAREIVRKFKIKSQTDWHEFIKNGNKPNNIPSSPAESYKKSGWISWGDWLGTFYIADQYTGWNKIKKINLLDNLEHTDLLYLDPIELQIIIDNGKLPTDFGILIDTTSGSEDRIKTLKELKKKFDVDSSDTDSSDNDSDDNDNDTNKKNTDNVEIEPVDDVDDEITSDTDKETNSKLPVINNLDDFHFLDNDLYAMDEESFNSLIQYRLRKLWNKVLNNEISIESILNEVGGKYFTMIKNMLLDEYNTVSKYNPPKGYNFRIDNILTEPNLMQKLIVHRLIKNKSYGNWSGTGAGKTLSFIIASREIDSRLTIVIALNSTIKQTYKSIKSIYSDSEICTKYRKGMKFDRSKYNYLILNYEKFQQYNSEELFQNLTNNNKIDFIVIDEVHNVKQRDEKESIRRGVLLRLMGRIREKNQDLYTLAMSATPVINNITEAKSLLTLLTGLNYNDIKDRKTISNAIVMFQLLTLNGLRYIPKYDINIQELTGHNMSNLNIDGEHLMNDLLKIKPKKYIEIEKLLLPEKLESISSTIKKGDIIYSYYTTGFIDEISKFINNLGFTFGTYTGEESLKLREENLEKFKKGEIDILIGSKPIGTGVNGLQEISNTMFIITLPWTDGEYSQLKGRIYRQGSNFNNVNIIIPQVKIELDNNDVWSWDMQRLNLIKNKKTLADAVVDGILPSKVLPSMETMCKKAIEALQNWKDRVSAGNIVKIRRNKINIDLYPEIDDVEEKRKRIDSELSEFNRKGKTTLSSTMHKTFTDNPDSWFRYHALRKERMSKWDEIPYEYIAAKIKNKKHIVVDFGCGENKMKEKLPNNKVFSFDHVAIDNSVIACDMKDVRQYLSDESVDIAVFSLALWGTNYKDYLKESYRVLNYGGFIYIAEPSKYYEGDEGRNELKTLITEAGFKLVGDIENRGKFIYIIGTKN